MQSAASRGTHACHGTEDKPHSQKRATLNKVHIISYDAQPLLKEKWTMYICYIYGDTGCVCFAQDGPPCE